MSLLGTPGPAANSNPVPDWLTTGSWQGPLPPTGWTVDYLESPTTLPTRSRNDEAVLPETVEAHATETTAQPLPEAPAIRVAGSLKPSDDLDMYRVPVPENFRAIRIDLSVAQLSPDAPEQLVLLDEAGHIIDSHAVDTQSGGLFLIVRKTNAIVGRALYVGVYQPRSAGWLPHGVGVDRLMPPLGSGRGPGMPALSGLLDPATSGTQYDLSFTIDSSSASTPTSSGSTMSGDATSGIILTSEPLRVAAASPDVSKVESAPSLSLSNGAGLQSVIGPAALAARPSPLRSATPPGGVFASGSATRPVDRRTSVVVDLSLIDLPTPSGSPGVGARDGPAPFPGDPIQAVDSAATPGGHPFRDRSQSRGRSTTDLAPLVWQLRKGRTNESQPTTSRSPRPVAVRPATDLDTVSSRGRPGVQLAVRAGFSVAYALVFTFLLPDLTARFQAALAHVRPRLRKRAFRRLLGRKAAR